MASRSTENIFQVPKFRHDRVSYVLIPVDASGVARVDQGALEGLRSRCTRLVNELLGDHLWQSEGFHLFPAMLPCEEGEGGCARGTTGELAVLKGRTAFGANIEDEWLVVFLLREITLRLPLVAQVADNDGEFLLIEAADCIPEWLGPDTSDNRVFLCGGKLHIIPLPTTPAELGRFPTGTPSLPTAMAVLQDPSCSTVAAAEAQASIGARIDKYPAATSENLHHARCYIPEAAGKLLQRAPSLISAAVTAFYERDTIDMKQCLAMTRFPPSSRVMQRVRFTRCLFAQLQQQRFRAPQCFGRLPPLSSVEHKAYDLGIKVACGFEILAHRGETLDDSGVETDRRWPAFLDALRKRGFFKGEMEGSREHTRRLNEAKTSFLQKVVQEAADPDEESASEDFNLLPIDVAARKVAQLLGELLTHQGTGGSESGEAAGPPPAPMPPDDSEEWLTLTSGDLDKLLKAAAGVPAQGGRGPAGAAAGEDRVEAEAGAGLGQVVEKVHEFVDKVSDYEGAELPGSGPHSDGDGPHEEPEGASLGNFPGQPVEFDPGRFVSMMEALLGDVAAKVGSDHSGPADHSQAADVEETLQEAVDAMEQQLSSTVMADTFDQPDEKPEGAPVDVDFNLVKNLLQSYSNQEGLAGPVSNLLGSMNLSLPDESRPREDTKGGE